MSIIGVRIELLRGKMREYGISAYIVPTSDFHGSEYVGEHFQVRRWLSGFTGSAGTLLITENEANLWTDGRYFLQAEEELRGSGIVLRRMCEPGVPTMEAYLQQALPEHGVVGMDGRTMDAAAAENLLRGLTQKQARIQTDRDLAGEIWQDRPPLPCAPIFLLPERYAGKSAAEKLAALRMEMANKRANVHVLTSLSDIAWLFNFRGADIEYNPVALCYAVVEQERAFLFIDPAKLNDETRAYFADLQVTTLPYHEIYAHCKAYTAADTVLLSKKAVNETLYRALAQAAIVDEANPTTGMKMLKNDTEQRNLRLAHQKDAVAMIRFLYRLKNGLLGSDLTETAAATALDALRMEQEGCFGSSFATIAGFNAHGAVIHYRAEQAYEYAIAGDGLLLVDSGGQYWEGTTDVTRTIAIGEPTSAQKRDFTLVLKGMLRLMQVKFPKGVTGRHLDSLAREPLWACMQDYRHGTGHGIGSFLCVHEDPVRINWQTAPFIALEPGMVLSDEPGLYVEGAYGIRHENQLLCVLAGESAYGQFYGFEALTLIPFDREAIDTALLNTEEIAQLNAYHARVYEQIAPLLTDDERQWLFAATLPL